MRLDRGITSNGEYFEGDVKLSETSNIEKFRLILGITNTKLFVFFSNHIVYDALKAGNSICYPERNTLKMVQVALEGCKMSLFLLN